MPQKTSLSQSVTPLLLAGKSLGRVKGLLFTRPGKEALLLMPCNDIHTVGMRYNLDIAFVDQRGCVLESYREVGPFRRLRLKEAVGVIERFSTCTTPWFQKGDRIGMVVLEGESNESMSGV